ncbi:MAG TPA: NAD(P)-dependent alcohol dehydrogenase [Steroidobacteraceae bacterium]|nr:NAD(P)-dependent alcohol dehydrogenase [Steroidobacteraceae bacterium]
MTLRRKILGSIALVLVVGLASLAYSISHDAACGTAPALADKAVAMRAIAYRCYGPPEVLKLETLAKPTPADDELLVRVHAASLNPLDWHYMRGTPYLVRLDTGFGRPDNPRLGVDFAGTVEAVGRNVTRFKPGDEVFGGKRGAFGEYVAVREARGVALKPPNMSFEQAAAVPIAALTALQALRDKGHLQPGQKVLINGASGGVGTFAVQIAKALGAEVTGVCSTRNLELVRSIGADHVIDYTHEDFTRDPQHYDLIVDTVGSHGLSEYRRVLTPRGALVIVGGPSNGNWIGPLTGLIEAYMLAPFVSQGLKPMLAELNKEDLALLAELMQNGKVTPVIDRRYPLAETAAALRYLETGHARGKVIINID